MTSKQLTRERLETIKSWRETYGAGSNVMLPAEEAEALARMALAAMDSEPVCFVSERNLATLTKYRASVSVKAEPVMVRPVALYRHAQPVLMAPKDHQIRELVNELRDIAIKYHGTQQLRERIARAIRTFMREAVTFRENENPSTKMFREIQETSTSSGDK